MVEDLWFHISFSNKDVCFLDTRISVLGNSLISDLYVKPSDRNKLLHFSCFHPPNVSKSIPLAQFERVSMIVSDEKKQEEWFGEMKRKLTESGYPKN